MIHSELLLQLLTRLIFMFDRRAPGTVLSGDHVHNESCSIHGVGQFSVLTSKEVYRNQWKESIICTKLAAHRVVNMRQLPA